MLSLSRGQVELTMLGDGLMETPMARTQWKKTLRNKRGYGNRMDPWWHGGMNLMQLDGWLKSPDFFIFSWVIQIPFTSCSFVSMRSRTTTTRAANSAWVGEDKLNNETCFDQKKKPYQQQRKTFVFDIKESWNCSRFISDQVGNMATKKHEVFCAGFSGRFPTCQSFLSELFPTTLSLLPRSSTVHVSWDPHGTCWSSLWPRKAVSSAYAKHRDWSL